MSKLTVKQWCDKAELALSTLPDIGIARITIGDNDEEFQEDASISEARDGVPGIYRIIDSSGKRIAECQVGRGGMRVNRPANEGLIAARHTALERQALTDGWSTLTNIVMRDNENLKKENKELQERVNELKEKICEMTLAADDENSDEQLYGLVKEVVDFFSGKKTKEELSKVSQEIFPHLSESAQAELLPLLNQRLKSWH